MILRYLVINDDLLCNVFTLQSVWIHYKENRYPLTGITVSNAQNCGIHQSGITVLCFRNDGSESPGILKEDTGHKQFYYIDRLSDVSGRHPHAVFLSDILMNQINFFIKLITRNNIIPPKFTTIPFHKFISVYTRIFDW